MDLIGRFTARLGDLEQRVSACETAYREGKQLAPGLDVQSLRKLIALNLDQALDVAEMARSIKREAREARPTDAQETKCVRMTVEITDSTFRKFTGHADQLSHRLHALQGQLHVRKSG